MNPLHSKERAETRVVGCVVSLAAAASVSERKAAAAWLVNIVFISFDEANAGGDCVRKTKAFYTPFIKQLDEAAMQAKALLIKLGADSP